MLIFLLTDFIELCSLKGLGKLPIFDMTCILLWLDQAFSIKLSEYCQDIWLLR